MGGKARTSMFDVLRRLGYSRRMLEQRSLVNRVHVFWSEDDMTFPRQKDYWKLVPDRRPHPAYMITRSVHPCYFHAYHYRNKRTIIKEAWVVKVERNSARAIKPLSERLV